MKTLWAKRANSSSYFPANFERRERNSLESIQGVQYLDLKTMPQRNQKLCLITNTHTKLSDWINYKDQIEFILHPNSGMDNFTDDLKDWSETPVVLGNTIRATAVAEWILSTLFQHLTPVKHHPQWPRSREWNRSLLNEKKILIMGFGHIGTIMNDVLVGFGAAPFIHDPYFGKSLNLYDKWDIVIICSSLNPGNIGILDKKFFNSCSSELLLINPARFEFINENSLRSFLSNSPQAKCYLDVHPIEPLPPDYWKECPQVITTPHLAGVWSGLIETMLQFESKIVTDWIQLTGNDFREKHKKLILGDRLTNQGWYR